MIFANKQLNRILNALLNNNKNAKRSFTKFMKSLPEQALNLIFDCQNIEYDGDSWSVNAYYAPNDIQIEIYNNNQALRLVMCPISHEQLAEIPLDNKNDIFLNDEDLDVDSPAFFNIIFNPNVDVVEDYDAQDFGYFIVKKQEKNGKVGYYLLSQALDDAGIYSSKVDIEDFIIDPLESEFKIAKKAELKNSANQPAPENYLPTQPHSRRSPFPRNPYPNF